MILAFTMFATIFAVVQPAQAASTTVTVKWDYFNFLTNDDLGDGTGVPAEIKMKVKFSYCTGYITRTTSQKTVVPETTGNVDKSVTYTTSCPNYVEIKFYEYDVFSKDLISIPYGHAGLGSSYTVYPDLTITYGPSTYNEFTVKITKT